MDNQDENKSSKVTTLRMVELAIGSVGNRYHFLTEEQAKIELEKQTGKIDIYKTYFTFDPEVIAQLNHAGKLKVGKLKADMLGRVQGPFVLDFDDENDPTNALREAIKTIDNLSQLGCPKEAISIFFSGFKGFHIEFDFKVFGIEAREDLADLYKEFAKYIQTEYGLKTIDFNLYQNNRLYRVVNTKNSKSGLFKIPLTLAELRTLSLEEIKNLAQGSREIPSDSTESNLGVWEWVNKQLLEEFHSLRTTELLLGEKVNIPDLMNLEKGSRDSSMLRITDSLLHKLSSEDTWFVINQINRTYQPTLDEESMRRIFNQATNFVSNNQVDPIQIPNALDFLKQTFGDTDWLVEELIPIGGSGIIVAKRESYKTWLALYSAYCITQGLPLWDKFSTNKNKVLYITNDDPPRNFQKRLYTFSFDDSFFVYHQGLPPFSIEQGNGSFEAVKRIIKAEGIGVLIVDILRNTHNKDSNTDKDAKLVFDEYKKLREANPSLVLIFLIHPSKEQQVEKRFGKRQSEEAVGSYYWEASVDTVLSLTKTTEDEIDQVVITVTKNKQSEKKVKPFIGIQRKGEGSIEFIYEEKIPDKLKVAEAKEYIQQILSEKTYLRREIIDLCVADKICKSRTAEQALKELNDEERVTHTDSKPHIYSLVIQSQPTEDSANRNTIYDLRNAESSNVQVNQQELSYEEEADGS